MNLPLFSCGVNEAAVQLLTPVLGSGQLGSNTHVFKLETELAKLLDQKFVVAVSDITHALLMALRCAGVRHGMDDEVLTLSFNCMSSNSAITIAGARPIWVEIDPQTASMDIASAASKITSRTKAVIVYHVAGYPADITAWRHLCDEHNLTLIEDCNNAMGARGKNGARVGSAGDFAIYSFYANRQVNGIEGGAVICRDQKTADRLKALRRFGIVQSKFRDHSGEIDGECDIAEIGFSASMSDVHAALARYGLASLDARLSKSRANASIMASELSNVPGITAVQYSAGSEPAFWVMLLLCEERNRLMNYLKNESIGCSKLHQPNHIYSGFGADVVSMPQTDEFFHQVLAVPCGWWMDAEACGRLTDLIAKFR